MASLSLPQNESSMADKIKIISTNFFSFLFYSLCEITVAKLKLHEGCVHVTYTFKQTVSFVVAYQRFFWIFFFSFRLFDPSYTVFVVCLQLSHINFMFLRELENRYFPFLVIFSIASNAQNHCSVILWPWIYLQLQR